MTIACLCAVASGCGGGGGGGGGSQASPSTKPARGATAVHRAAKLRRPLERALTRGAREVGASGATAAVMVRGRLVWSGSSGAARGAGTVFLLASLTKPFVAALTLRRVEQNRLSLDDTVAVRLGDAVPSDVGRATVGQLLGHTSGLSDYFADPGFEALATDPGHNWTEPELLRAIHRASGPGAYHYSNSDYILIGAILRRIGGRPTGVQLRDEILRPLRIAHTSLDREPALEREFVGGAAPPQDDWGELFSAGGMAGTAPDVARFFDALLVERTVVHPRSLARMERAGPNPDYGLGLAATRLGSCRLRGHTGFLSSTSTAAFSDARSGTTIVVLLSGAQPGTAKRVLLGLARTVGRRVLPC
ncbi:MAG: D-alanyl-D-alanine carboxypeptidase [Solirubrobacteraceae bacterium]|jgi:D-alanyl-D-alanine carboxypeptidase|nr:D-alanyl-D-alanine carboxypeptidase [Solirubrobacteraceae bacterium]